MNVITGDDTGLVKLVSLKTDGEVRKFGTQTTERGGVQALKWAGYPNTTIEEEEKQVAIALGRGGVEVWDTKSLTKVYEAQPFTLKHYHDKLIGMDVLNSQGLGASERRFIAATSKGAAKIFEWDHPTTTAATKASKTIEWQLGDNLEKLVLSPDQSVAVCGGQRMASIWDVETQQQTFKSKNALMDDYGVVPRYYDLAYTFVPPTADGGDFTPNTRFLSTNEYKQLRLYDTKASNRPVWSIETSTNPIHAMAYVNDGATLITGDAGGRIQRLDMRHEGMLRGVFRGGNGSVRAVAPHATLPFVSVVGLDRHLRVYSTKSRELLKQCYLTQRLTTCLFSRVEYNRKKARMTQKAIEKAKGVMQKPKTFGDYLAEQNALKAAKKAALREARERARAERRLASHAEASEDEDEDADEDAESDYEDVDVQQVTDADQDVWDEFESRAAVGEARSKKSQTSRKGQEPEDDSDDAQDEGDEAQEYEVEYEAETKSSNPRHSSYAHHDDSDNDDDNEEEEEEEEGLVMESDADDDNEKSVPIKRKAPLTKSSKKPVARQVGKKSVKLSAGSITKSKLRK